MIVVQLQRGAKVVGQPPACRILKHLVAETFADVGYHHRLSSKGSRAEPRYLPAFGGTCIAQQAPRLFTAATLPSISPINATPP